MQALPDTVIQSNPDLCFEYAWVLALSGQPDATDRFLQVAEAAFSDDPQQYSKVLSAQIHVARIRHDLPLANQSLIYPLTNRELEVLQLIANGLTNQQIAKKLFITKGTVKYYSSTIYSKLQATNRTQAVAYARELGILQ